jgi:hypothetical protein
MNFSIPDEDFHLQVWHDNEHLKSVKLHDHFIPIKESSCKNGFLLEPEEMESDAFNILANGSIHYTNLGEDQPIHVFGASEFCIVNNVKILIYYQLKGFKSHKFVGFEGRCFFLYNRRGYGGAEPGPAEGHPVLPLPHLHDHFHRLSFSNPGSIFYGAGNAKSAWQEHRLPIWDSDGCFHCIYCYLLGRL